MEKINLVEILKDCPKGMELDCIIYNNVEFEGIINNKDWPIAISVEGYPEVLNPYGCISYRDYTKCVIFPKGKTTWEGFVPPIQFRDGDIAATNCNCSESQLFIVSGGDSQKQMKCYVSLFEDGKLDVDAGNYYVTRYATEEEKQKLFKAIKDNGYKWNPETKTLDKLIEPKFELGDSIRIKGTSAIYVVTEIREGCYMLDDKDIYLTFKTQDDWELVPNKFDINTLKPFDKVLVRGDIRQKWTINFFGFIDNYKKFPFECLGRSVTQCVPYEGNEHLLGTNNECNEYYKTWEK